jgi:hypothetical protein
MGLAKLTVKLPGIEIDFEGDHEFIDGRLIETLEKINAFSSKRSTVEDRGPSVAGMTEIPSPQGGTFQMTTASIAAKLDAKKGPEVAKAAIANLAFVKGQSKFRRAEIFEEMKNATGRYKQSMASNLSAILRSLVSDNVIIEAEKEVYTLTPSAEGNLKSALTVG